MVRAQIFAMHADGRRAFAPLIGLMLFLWLIAAALALTVIGLETAPGQAGNGEALRAAGELVPKDARVFAVLGP